MQKASSMEDRQRWSALALQPLGGPAPWRKFPLAWIMTHNYEKGVCASELGPLRI